MAELDDDDDDDDLPNISPKIDPKPIGRYCAQKHFVDFETILRLGSKIYPNGLSEVNFGTILGPPSP